MADVFSSPVQFLKGVGEKRALLFKKLGIETVQDLINCYPRAYEDWSTPVKIRDAQLDTPCCIKARLVDGVTMRRSKGGMTYYTTAATDGSDIMRITIFNNRFAAEKLVYGKEYLFFGKLTVSKNFSREMNSPVFQPIEGEHHTGLKPVYKLTEGITLSIMRNTVERALSSVKEQLIETLPDSIRRKYSLCSLVFAYENIHFPKDRESLEVAQRRLVFEEQLILRLGMSSIKNRQVRSTDIITTRNYIDEFKSCLPFNMTSAQSRTCDEIHRDTASGVPMCRLVQGDVGSGKTAVAAAAIYNMVKNGYQCAFMAPTEILAKQHYSSLSKMFENTGLKTVLLTGTMTKKKKTQVYELLSRGKVHLAVGTHALLQDDVTFKNLGLCITDEQHRFGVRQRAILADKGKDVHMLVMSATPIPRSLALIIYGDLDISLLDEMPPGRQKIDTFYVDSSYRKRIFNFIKKHIDEGKQAYLVCPLVEENEESQLISAEKLFSELQTGEFKGYKTGLLHGKMKPQEKDDVMLKFSLGEIDMLIATTVVEVGVDVPNAVVMVIENAERFGLSQLHQLRGRVGRGKEKSYCILISDAEGDAAKRRLEIMQGTSDGFKIADEDLKLRGPGDFFGSRQHGLPDLKMSQTLSDTSLLKLTSEAADEIIKDDPTLSKAENKPLKKAVEELFERSGKNAMN